jgi:hypothetical protein
MLQSGSSTGHQKFKLSANHHSERQKVFSRSLDDVDSDFDESDSSIDSSIVFEHPINELFHQCSQVVTSIASLHESVCESWKEFLNPAFKNSISIPRSASMAKNWQKFVDAVDLCSEPRAQLQLQSKERSFQMPTAAAVSFVRLCQYLVVSKIENVQQQERYESSILKMGLHRRSRRVKQFIFSLWTGISRLCKERMVTVSSIIMLK